MKNNVMIDATPPREEARYGMPAADHILFNRHYIVGYSYYFRQPKWTLEIVNPPVIDADPMGVEREDNFRPDLRIPEMFRAEAVDFRGSGYDRGHMVPSANHNSTELENSETFLLSNMSPQKGDLNRYKWRELEQKIRQLNNTRNILETFVVTGPIFNFDEPVTTIGTNDRNKVTIPVPHAYFKSILTEDKKGRLKIWSFIMPNEKCELTLKDYLVSTTKIEQYAGFSLWDRLVGRGIEREKKRIRTIW